jgi:hypothetical protein
MKDYNKVAAKILKIVKANIVQCGSPTCYNSVNLRIQITEPYIIGYVFYVAYNGTSWTINYTYESGLDIRYKMTAISVKTEKEMLSNVKEIVDNIREKCGV